MGKTFSSAVEVHKHKPFSTASSGKSGLFPGGTAHSRGCTAASASRAVSLSNSCSADVPLPDSNNCHPVQQSEWKSWLNIPSRLDQSRHSHHPATGTWFNGVSVPTHRSGGDRGQCWWEHPAGAPSPLAPGAQRGSFLHPPSAGQDRQAG